MAFFQETIYFRIQYWPYVIKIDEKNKGRHWVSLCIDRNFDVYFDSCRLILFQNKYNTKSKINQLLTIYLEYKIINLLCVDFIVSLS